VTTTTRPAAQRTGRTRTRTPTAHATTGQPAAAPAATDANSSNGNGSDTNGSDKRVRAALIGGTDLTVAALAEATGLGRSTVSKALTRLEAAGHAARTTSGSAGRARQPDRWNPTPTPTPTTTAPPSPPKPPARKPEGAAKVERGFQPEAIPQPEPDTQPGTVSEPEASVPPTAGTADEATGEDQPTAGRRPAGSRHSRGGRRSTGDTPSTSGTPAGVPDDGGDGRRNPKTGTSRLAPGALTQLVADHFGAHPGVPLTSGEVGRALSRSGGAVRNAADKLTGDGVLRLLDGTPRRYTTAE